MIRLAIVGSTGSIGSSALEVVARHPDRFTVVALAANRRVEPLKRQVARFRPDVAVLADPDVPLPSAGCSWRSGRAEVAALAARDDVDVVLNALVGAAGLEVTLTALAEGKRLALANKESLVVGGALVVDAATRGGGELVPVDSEHSAILQCLAGARDGTVSRLVLTASGGPFRGRNRAELETVTPADALDHPTWDMGSKITIDSATLANKSLEVIEAHYLYGIDYDRIDAVVHPQSIVHSFVEFVDGSVLAQLGEPDMELPILYAFTHPERAADTRLRTFDPVACSPLTFEDIDHDAFPLFSLGVSAGRAGGSAPAGFNAGNEIAVEAFLKEEIRFLDMVDVVQAGIEAAGDEPVRELAQVLEADRRAREAARAVAQRARYRGHRGRRAREYE